MGSPNRPSNEDSNTPSGGVSRRKFIGYLTGAFAAGAAGLIGKSLMDNRGDQGDEEVEELKPPDKPVEIVDVDDVRNSNIAMLDKIDEYFAEIEQSLPEAGYEKQMENVLSSRKDWKTWKLQMEKSTDEKEIREDNETLKFFLTQSTDAVSSIKEAVKRNEPLAVVFILDQMFIVTPFGSIKLKSVKQSK